MLDNSKKEALKQALEKIDRNEAKMKGSKTMSKSKGKIYDGTIGKLAGAWYV